MHSKKSVYYYFDTLIKLSKYSIESYILDPIKRINIVRKLNFKRKQRIYEKEGRLCYCNPDGNNEQFNQIDFTDIELSDLVFSFWTGNNELSKNRKKGLSSLKKKIKLQHVLITPENLQDYILPEAPLHKAYHLLSLVHKSDYLRCYFMHYYGGGFADIKTFYFPWTTAFNKLKQSNKYIVGYQEVNEDSVATVEDTKLQCELRFHFPLLIGNGAYICRPGTPFTSEWITELDKVLEHYYPSLQKSVNNGAEYPIPYTALLGNIFHPLCLKYHDKILIDDDLKPSFANYK